MGHTWKSEEIHRSSLWFFWRLLCKWRLVSIKSCLSQSPDFLFQSLPKTMVMFIWTKLIWPGCTTLLVQCIKVSQSLDLSNWIFNKMSVNTPPLTKCHGMWPVGGPSTRGLCSCWWYFQKPKSPSAQTGLLTSAGVVPPIHTTSPSVAVDFLC